METKDKKEVEKEALDEWKMIKSHKPFYIHGNNVSYSNNFVKRYKSKIFINNMLYIWGLIICLVCSICFGYFGLSDKSKYYPLSILFYIFIGIDVIVVTFATLNFIFNHVYTKQYKNISVAIYCNWWCKILEINNIQKDFGSYSKVMIHEVDKYIVTVKGKNIEIKEK